MTVRAYPATRVWETSATTGTGSYTLGGAKAGYRTFASAYSSGVPVPYVVTDGTSHEWGIGTYTTGSLARTTILGSSNAGAAVNWTASALDVFVSFLAEIQPFMPVTGDPSPLAEGMTWYDVSSQQYRGMGFSGGSWAAGGALATARDYLAGAGTQTAALSFGGITGGSTVAANTEAYNGTSWSAGGALATARGYLAGAGTQAAALSFGGYTTVAVANTEAYNGTSWAAGGALATARYYLAGAGTQTAALSFGGLTTVIVATTEAYNGTLTAKTFNLI